MTIVLILIIIKAAFWYWTLTRYIKLRGALEDTTRDNSRMLEAYADIAADCGIEDVITADNIDTLHPDIIKILEKDDAEYLTEFYDAYIHTMPDPAPFADFIKKFPGVVVHKIM